MAEARRTIDLLWFDEPASRRGRKKGLTVAQVVDAAIVLADAEGLDAVSMRRVAQELGVVPMTLYTYVPDKAALLDLMLDALYLRMPRAGPGGGALAGAARRGGGGEPAPLRAASLGGRVCRAAVRRSGRG